MLDDLYFWEMRAIIAGYRKREQAAWERTRWQTFMLMHNGMIDLSGAGIDSPTDLIAFPWDDDDASGGDDDDITTPDDVEHMRAYLRQLNAQTDKHSP